MKITISFSFFVIISVMLHLYEDMRNRTIGMLHAGVNVVNVSSLFGCIT